MKGYDLEKRIQKERQKHPDNIFIKTWRKEEDWIDFDLVARFLETLDYSQDFGGFSLIDEQEMWQTLQNRCGSRLSKVQREGKWVLQYKPPKGAEIEEKLPPEFPYSPDSLLRILEVETQGNYVD
jgi:hypothetical protein